jgi:uncharacterized protein
MTPTSASPAAPGFHRTRRLLIATALGAAIAVAATVLYDAIRYVSNSAPPSAQAADKPLREFSVDPLWVKSGNPVFRNVETAVLPGGRTLSGLWACDGPAVFEWRFHTDETLHLIEGKVEVHYQGKRFTLLPGNTATFHAGTTAVWHVQENVKKAYILHYPGKLALVLRRWFAREA